MSQHSACMWVWSGCTGDEELTQSRGGVGAGNGQAGHNIRDIFYLVSSV